MTSFRSIICSIFIFLSFVGVLYAAESTCPAKEICPHPSVKASKQFEEFCINATRHERCCHKKTKDVETLYGLDLSNCNLEHLNLKNVSTELQGLFLMNNTLSEFKIGDLTGFTNLQLLVLPANTTCPGEHDGWYNITNNDQTGDWNCIGQQDYCIAINANCTDTSVCVPFGPGLGECECKDGYYGYKCLKYGDFPNIALFVTIAVITVLLTIGLYYSTGRYINCKLD